MTGSISEQPVRPLGSRARVLLASAFGPYAQDDRYGSRLINPMELYHNQVTRVQQAFSLRTFHRSWARPPGEGARKPQDDHGGDDQIEPVLSPAIPTPKL